MSTLEEVMVNRIYRKLLLEAGYAGQKLKALVIANTYLIYEVLDLGWVVTAKDDEITITKKKIEF